MKFCQSIPQSRWRGRTLMLLALLLCIALPKTSSAQRVSVVLENVSLAEALKKVSAASGYEFFYNSNVVLKSDKRITASFEGTELKTVLDHVFSGTEFSYRIKDRTIVVVPRPAQPAPEEPAFVEIAGRITDGSNKAPMAGVTDMPYRILCREQGAGLVCMEMVSAKAILYKNKNTQELLKVDERERPVSLQLFGSDPDIVADIAASLEDGPYDIFDINMGCPVPKIVKNGEGSALMRNPKLVEEILTKLVKAVKKPVTVKFRKGFNDTCINAVEIAKIAESAGVAAVAVHGRTREQYYSGKADWNIIREVKKAVKIPVIGNGDVFTPQDAKRLVEETGCDGIMVARGAKGNPWIFKQITHYLETGELLPRPSVEELKAMILRHGQMMMEFKGELAGMREMRKHVAWYTAGYPNSAALRNEINSVATLEELTELIGTRL